MKATHFTLLGTLLAAAGCASHGPTSPEAEAMAIIALHDGHGMAGIRESEYVKLQLPYGLIIRNGEADSDPSYYLFSRDKRDLFKTHDVDAFLAEIEKLPDGTAVDMVSKCTVPFYTQWGVNIDAQYERISSLLRRKRIKRVSSMQDDERHASFCYCEGGFTILAECKASGQSPGGDGHVENAVKTE